MFYAEKLNAKLCNIIKIEELRLPREYRFFELGNVQDVGSEEVKGYHGLQFLLYLISDNADLKDATGFVPDDSI